MQSSNSAQEQLQDRIFNWYSEGDSVLVFPSEIAARSWSSRIARVRGICKSGRFISWDSFKERVFFGTETRKPANQVFRGLFVDAILEQNIREPVFRRIVQPEFRHLTRNYRQAVLSALPFLPKICVFPDASLEDIIGPTLASDFRMLFREYEQFLQRYQRYEPGWQTREYMGGDASYIILLPELLEDFREYEQQLSSCEFVEIFSSSHIDSHLAQVEFHEYDDYRTELSHCVLSIAQEITAGRHPEDICITLPNYDRMLPRLMYYAKSAGVPLAPRRGKPLIEYVSVSWLKELSAIGHRSISYSQMRSLLLHPGLLWRDAAGPGSLIDRAAQFNMLTASRRSWLQLSEKIPGVRALLDGLFAIQGAKNPAQLHELLNAFQARHLRTNDWPQEQEFAYQRCVETLKGIREIAEEFSGMVGNALQLAVDVLSSGRYLPQSNAPGVGVYDYRVLAGMCTPVHYCINMTSEATSIRPMRPASLREESAQAILGAAPELSEDFLQAYPYSGDRVIMSFSRKSDTGSALPSTPFLQKSEAIRHFSVSEVWAEDRVPADDCTTISHEVYDARNGDIPPWKLPISGMEDSCIDLEAEGELGRRLGLQGGDISVTRLESYLKCAFHYPWEALGVEERITAPDLYPARDIGTAFHGMAEELFRTIREVDGGERLQAHMLNAYKSVADLLVKRAFGADAGKFFPRVSALVREQFRQKFLLAFIRVLEQECARNVSGRIISEFPLSGEVELRDGRTIILRARVDAMIAANNSLTIIDFKTGQIPRPKDILGDLQTILPSKKKTSELSDEDLGALLAGSARTSQSIQLAAYSMLLRTQGYRPTRLGYYSIKRSAQQLPGEFHSIVNLEGDDGSPRSSLPVIREEIWKFLEGTVLDAVERWHAGLLAGDFRMSEQHDQNFCRHRRLSRRNFAVEAGSRR